MKRFIKNITSAVLAIIFLIVPIISGISSFADTEDNDNILDIDSKLPEVHIRTNSGKNPEQDDDKVYFKGTLRVELNDYYSECENAYTGETALGAGIRTRGNSTRTFLGAKQTGKYSYRIKLDEKADMFGMGKSKDWILLSNVYDPTSMRNVTAYELARALGLAYCDSTWVVLYLNGEYRGLYQFCESISISSNRVDITDWGDIVEDVAYSIAKKEGFSSSKAEILKDKMSENMAWVTSGKFENYTISDYYSGEFDITSGYLIEYDSFDNKKDKRPYLFESGRTPAGVMLKIDSPEYTYTNPEMLEYVRNLILDFEEAVLSDDFCTSDGRHYSEFCDMNSLVDFWILQSVVMNGEFGIRSMFFYIENGKIYWSPVWDFDCGAGNHLTVTTSASGWNGNQNNRNHWYKALYKDSYFVTLLQERFADIRPTLDTMIEGIEIYRQYIEAEAERDYDKYGARPFNNSNNVSYTFDREFDFYYKWQKDRIKWLEDTLFKDVPGVGDVSFSEKISLTLKYSGGSALEADKLTQYGAKSTYIYDTDKNDDLTFKVTTTHTTSTRFEMYINGVFYKEYKLTNSAPASGTIELDKLNLTSGVRNSVHFVLYNKENNAYNRYGFTILMSDIKNPTANQVVVQINTDISVVDKDSDFTLPNAPRAREGLEFKGWTDGSNIYEAGSVIKASESVALYEKWVHTDGTAVLFTDYIDIPYGNALWIGDVTENKNNPDKDTGKPENDIVVDEIPDGNENNTNGNGENEPNKEIPRGLIIGLILGAAVIIIGTFSFAISFKITRKRMENRNK
ncbi:MAG: hypothetical protein E7633_00120 [Ruminococcaceae bacterium]|nr:hypothetical protein [Oscillospiraceae bacterium]